jgi:hypothetical protein
VALSAACAIPWPSSRVLAQEPARVVPVYLVPRDQSFSNTAVRYHLGVLRDVRRWYGRVLGGRTFVYEPLVVQRSRYTFDQLAADSFQAWWPLLQREFDDYGWDWNAHARFKLLFLTHGAGAWAGSDSENGGLDSASQAGRVDKGDWGGLAVIGDSSVAGVLAGVCPEVARGKADSSVATAWWCSGSTYRGTVAHELGHTFGLPHPDAFHPGFRCADSTAYTIMQCHWWWGHAGLLDYEITHLRSLDFFAFDTLPAYALLLHQPALTAAGTRRRDLEDGDSLTWIDGRGGGTGYPWAILFRGPGAIIEYAAPGRGVLAFDLGLARGATGDASLVLRADARPIALIQVTADRPPQRIVVPLDSARRIGFRLARRRGVGALVVGNPRIYR